MSRVEALFKKLDHDKVRVAKPGEFVTEIEKYKPTEEMMTGFDKRVVDFIFDKATSEERIYIFEKEFKYFFLYHYSNYFMYKAPSFHFEMYDDLKFANHKHLMWCMFRESAKTSIAKAYVVWCICHKKKKNINWDSYDKKNAEAALYDIAIELQTNPTLIEDYGQLFFQQEGKSSTKKSIGEFITNNGIKVKAFSVRESARGRVFNQYRPDLIIFDDIENYKTVVSEVMTDNIIKHFKEFIAGIASYANIIILCNKISNDAAIAQIMDYAYPHKDWKVREVPVYTGEMYSGELAWPDKYVWSDIEASLANTLISDPARKKVSIESKRNEMVLNGENVFKPEMLLLPHEASKAYFKYDKEAKSPLISKGDWRFYKGFQQGHRYALGADTAAGVGEDSCAAVLIDFTLNEVVACYDSNTIDPDLFAYEIATVGRLYGDCLLIPEARETGWAVITKLKDIYHNIFTRMDDTEIMDTPTNKLGFLTTGQSKPVILSTIKTQLEWGNLILNDEKLIKEVQGFRRRHAKKSPLGTTQHFDLLMALAVGYAGQDVAIPCFRQLDSVDKKQETFDKYSVL